jgi:hypothetical protein
LIHVAQEKGPVQPPVAGLVGQREMVSPAFGRVPRRVEALVNAYTPGPEPNRPMHVAAPKICRRSLNSSVSIQNGLNTQVIHPSSIG